MTEQQEKQPEPSFEELFAKITHPKQRLFLENYPKFRYVSDTERAIGLGERTAYNWIEDDKVFNDAYEALKKQIVKVTVALHEKNIEDVCLSAKTPAQSRIFGSLVRLRAEAPEKYREKQEEHRLVGDITVKIAVPGYTYNPVPLPEVKKELKEGGKAPAG